MNKALATPKSVNEWIAVAAGLLLLSSVLVTVFDVAARPFGFSLGGTDELSGYAMAIATSWGMSYGLTHLTHVRIDLLRSRCNGMGQTIFDLVAILSLSGTALVIAYRVWPVLSKSTVDLRRQLMERSLDLAILMGPISEYSIDNIELPSIELAWFTSTQKEAPNLCQTPIISYNRNSRPYRELRRKLIKLYGEETNIFPSSSIHAGLEMVASGIGVGLFPTQLGTELIRQGRIREFDPGWTLQPLKSRPPMWETP